MLAIKAEMFLFNVVLATLALVAVCNSGEAISTPSAGSEGDQYPKREEIGGLGVAPFSQGGDATDRTHRVGIDGGLMRLLTRTETKENEEDPTKPKNLPWKKSDRRPKRSYQPYEPGYQLQYPQFEGLNTWRTSFYPIQRPYFVPIYGYDGRIPLYYPPCTYYHSVPIPPQQPPYVGPTYLPPITTTAPPLPKNETTMMPIDDRFGDNDDDDRPIWDNNGPFYPGRATPRPSMPPTRKPMTGTSTVPPLVHKETDSQQGNTAENDVATVAPSIPRPQGPSKCVWAIVSCCSTSSKDISYECFDQLGCGGPFWDVSPCDTEYAKAAIQTALNYYNSRF